MKENTALGQEVLDYLFRIMAIDEQWSLREPLKLTWWAGHLAQRIWVESVPNPPDPTMIRVHAETDVLKTVIRNAKTVGLIDVTNKFASLSALVWYPEDGRITLRCSAYVTAENVGWLRHVIGAAVAIQVTDAHIKGGHIEGLGKFAKFFDAQPDESQHPRSGVRLQPDQMLQVIETTFAPHGQRVSPFTEANFTDAVNMNPHPWTLATAGVTGLTAELPFYGEDPSLLSIFKRKKVGSALLTASSQEKHPQLGSGALLRLTLPLDLKPQRANELTNELNLEESREQTWAHGLGAWCSDQRLNTIAYVSFLPAAIHKPDILKPLLWHMAARSKWARQYLS